MEAEKQELENLLIVMRATTKSGAVTILTTEAIKPILVDGVPIHYNENWVLGEGSYGTVVYRGTFGSRPVAVKRMHLDNVKEKTIIKEIETLKTCDVHENIVQYFCTQIVQQHVLIALELCDTTLKRWVANKRSIDISPVEVLRQMTVGLGFLHQRYIIHRDLKPENILLCSQTKMVKISDFGLSRKVTGENNYVQTCGAGTLGWVAPEVLKQIVSEDTAIYKFSFASDLFALGCVYYYVLSDGQHAFGDSVRRSANILDGKVQIDPTLFTGVCGQTVTLLHLMMAKNPKLRPSCSDLITCPSFWTQEHRHLFLEQLKAQGEAAMEEVIHFKPSEYCTFDHDLDIQALNALGNNKVEKAAGCAIHYAFLESIKLEKSGKKPTAKISPTLKIEEQISQQVGVQNGTDIVAGSPEINNPVPNSVTVNNISVMNVQETAIYSQHKRVYNENDMTRETTTGLINNANLRFNKAMKKKYSWVALACVIAAAIAIVICTAVIFTKDTKDDDAKSLITASNLLNNDDNSNLQGRNSYDKSVWDDIITDSISELKQMSYSAKVSKLFEIVKYENLVVIKAVLEDKIATKDLVVTDISNDKQKSLLHVAVEYRDYAVVEYLMITHRFSTVLLTSRFKDSLIHDCIKDIYEVSPLRFEGKRQILQLLFKTQPILVESRDFTKVLWTPTPLHVATYKKFQNGKQLEFIKFLIDYKANVNARDKDGDTPLHLIVFQKPLTSNTLEIIKLLIQNNADPDATSKTGEPFLSVAIKNCKSPEILNQILRYLSSINRTKTFNYINANGQTLFHSIISYFEPMDETLQLFKANGVDLNAVDKNGKSALVYAIAEGRDKEFLNTLIGFGADWELKTKTNETILHQAAMFGNVAAIKLFVSLGSDINAVDAYNYSPLAEAILHKRNESVLHTLIESGANFRTMNKRKDTALHYAAMHGNLPALELFFSMYGCGCDVNVVNTEGFTALHNVFLGTGANSNAYGLVRVLMNYGANPYIETKSGKSAIDLAKALISNENMKERVLSLLEIRAIEYVPGSINH